MIPVNEAQQQLQDLIDSVSQSHQPIVIAGQSNNAVLLSEADWASVQETLYLLSIPGMRDRFEKDWQLLRSRSAISSANSVGHGS